MAYDSRVIANTIIDICRDRGVQGLSMMKLIKLVYYAHGWHLGLNGTPLTSDSPQAWQYGPVYRDLYNCLPYVGAMEIVQPVRFENGKEAREQLSTDEQRLLERIVDVYGGFSAFELSEMTHKEGSPWDATRRERGFYQDIDNELIRQYFAQLITS